MSKANYSITADRIAEVLPMFHRSRRVPLFVGKPGIAKTAFVREAVAHMSRGLPAPMVVRELHLASMSEVDVRGYLVPYDGKAVFTAPEFWSTVQANPQGGVLFLDEFPQATHEVQKAVAPLILEGRIGEYTLPPGWSVALAGNGLEDNAGANSLLSHIVNRVTMINVKAPDVDMWVTWAATQDLPPELIAFAKLRPGIVFDADLPNAPDTPYCTPRSLHILGDLANQFTGGLTKMVADPVGMAMMAGTIGDGPSSELSALVRTTMTLPTYEQVVADPLGTVIPEKPDQRYAMVMLAAVRAKEEHADPVCTYLARFAPNDSLTGFIALIRRSRGFARSTAMRDFVIQNKGMLEKFGKYISQSM